MPALDAGIVEEIRIKVPRKWKIIFHNDDFTPMDFVVSLLEAVFNKNAEDAAVLMQTVHDEGRAVVGLYTKEIADTKVLQALRAAEEHQHPLLVTSEES